MTNSNATFPLGTDLTPGPYNPMTDRPVIGAVEPLTGNGNVPIRVGKLIHDDQGSYSWTQTAFIVLSRAEAIALRDRLESVLLGLA